MPKLIQMAVGRSGLRPSIEDVVTVQYLLNCVPEHRGGPSKELRVDGIVTAETIEAIVRFQVAALTLVDGCVTPTGATLTRLQQFDPFPNQPLPAWVRQASYNPKELMVDK